VLSPTQNLKRIILGFFKRILAGQGLNVPLGLLVHKRPCPLLRKHQATERENCCFILAERTRKCTFKKELETWGDLSW
jgi:hypothetical protein